MTRATNSPSTRTIKVTEAMNRTHSHDGGSFVRKWATEGVTKMRHDLTRARIEVSSGPSSLLDEIAELARQHERGHVAVCQGLRDAYKDAGEYLATYPRFAHEVEAWLQEVRQLDYFGATFVLDALNTYRRGLGIKDEEWEEARCAIESLVLLPYQSQVVLYVPLEPDEGDDLPPCSEFGDPGQEGGWSDDDADDIDADNDGDEEGDGNKDSGQGTEPDDDEREGDSGDMPDKMTPKYGEGTSKFQPEWNDPRILRDLLAGIDADDLARRAGLDVQRMSPMAKAIVKQLKDKEQG